jgi:hypothetical protein
VISCELFLTTPLLHAKAPPIRSHPSRAILSFLSLPIFSRAHHIPLCALCPTFYQSSTSLSLSSISRLSLSLSLDSLRLISPSLLFHPKLPRATDKASRRRPIPTPPPSVPHHRPDIFAGHSTGRFFSFNSDRVASQRFSRVVYFHRPARTKLARRIEVGGKKKLVFLNTSRIFCAGGFRIVSLYPFLTRVPAPIAPARNHPPPS